MKREAGFYSQVLYDVFQISYRALYNVSGVHSLPSIFNIMSQSVLNLVNSSAPSITTYNKRWPALCKFICVILVVNRS